VKHLVSFRRQVFMVLKNGVDEIYVVLKFQINSFDYAVFATSDTTIKCFSYGKIGYLDCPDKMDSASTEQVVSALKPLRTGRLQLRLLRINLMQQRLLSKTGTLLKS